MRIPAIQFTASIRRAYLFRSLQMLAGLFPLTTQGVLTLLVTAGALSVFGYGSMDLVVFALTICALAILVSCLFCAIGSGVLIQRRVHKLMDAEARTDAIELECGYPNESGFELPGMGFLPLIRLDWRIIYPDATQTRVKANYEGALVEEILPQKRCLTDQVIRQFTVSDVLGFCRFSWRQKQQLRCRALPQTNTIKALPLLQSMTAEDGMPNPAGDPEGDRMEIRRYAPGDSVRDIMWKAYARSGQLNVRLAERSVFHSQKTIAYLLSGPEDEAAAAIARLALEQGVLGEDWAFGADGSDEVCNNLPSALDAVARSRAINEPHQYGLDQFLERSNAGAGVHCILFASATPGPWLAALQNTIRAYSGQVSLVLATDGISEPQTSPFWRKILLQTPQEAATGTSHSTKRPELLGLLTELGQLVESTLIVDRHSGVSFDKHLRKV